MPMRILTIKVPDTYLILIDRLVQKGLFSCRSEFVRQAIREKLEQYFSKYPELLQDSSIESIDIEIPKSNEKVKVVYLE